MFRPDLIVHPQGVVYDIQSARYSLSIRVLHAIKIYVVVNFD